MTLAIALWLTRSLSVALWLVEHVVLVIRARRAGSTGGVVWALPALACWRSGDRVGPAAWWALGLTYLVATLAAMKLR